jgi:hypothetical protein
MSVLTSFGRRRRPILSSTLVVGLTAAALGGLVSAAPAQALGQKVLLRSLVVSSGDPATIALATELDREGIPYTLVNVATAGRPAVDDAFLADAATGTGRYQAVFLPNQAGGGLSAAEMTSLATYETAYGVRQVNGYDWPTAAMGLNAPSFSGALDGGSVTVTADGLAGPFSYLKGTLGIEDVDPAVTESYGYLATPSTTLAAGQTFTPLLTATPPPAAGSTASGVVAGVYAHDGREELVLPVSFNQNMQWFNEIAPGLVSWATRGIHLGYQRNYFNVQVDDVFLPDSRWSVAGNCTPGDNCVDSTVTSADVRMSTTDVANLVNWQNTRGYKLDMVFNGGGAELAKAPVAGETTSDPAANAALLAAQAQFRWINHTYTHQFLGCTQIAPTVTGQTWHCATTATETPRQDPEIPSDPSGGLYWDSQAGITQQVGDNITWAKTNGLTNFDAAELVTGEHSGLATLPQQATDNPFLAPALAALGVRYTASDASRETDSRLVAGGTTATVPRHPMNIFYNAGTYQDEVDEYNWIYTSAANGGGDICTANPTTSTCITPLDASSEAAAKASFDSYLQPIEVRNALKFVLTNDPRPFYAHQSNLAEDGILYPVLNGILDTYASAYDTTKAPLVQTGLTGQYQALARIKDWRTASAALAGAGDGYVDSTGVHLPATSVAVPVTVPAGSVGAGLEAYAGSLSGWVGGGSSVTVPGGTGGYLVATPTTVPGAPTIGTAVPGSTTATVAWTAPASDGGSPVTGYVVRVYAGTSTTPSATTVTAPAGATSVVVTGLTNGTAYRFDVAATNAVGAGPASALSAAVTPRVALAPVPLNVVATPANASATVSWTAPTTTAGITGYRVRAYLGTTATVARTVNVAAGQTAAAVTGLLNGTGYSFDVAGVYGTAVGPVSARSAVVTPTLTAQASGAPTITAVTPAQSALAVAWAAPADTSVGTPTGYRIRAYLGSTAVVARTVTTTGTGTTATLTGLVNGIAYTVDVTAMYGTTVGGTSARSAAVVPTATVPTAPVIGTAASGASGGAITATARWSAPASNGGSAILGYRVTASRMSGTVVVGTTTSALLASSARSVSMTLPAGQYTFTVVAVNLVGTSPASAASNAVTAR